MVFLFSPHHCSLQSCECSKLGLAWCDCTAPRDPDGGFQLVIGVPNNGWFLLGKIPSRNGWLGVALFLETRCRSKTWNSGEAGFSPTTFCPKLRSGDGRPSMARWMAGTSRGALVTCGPCGPSGQLLWLRKSTRDSTIRGILGWKIASGDWNVFVTNCDKKP